MKIKLTPIALLSITATALYWRRRAIQAENRLSARVLADERERAERGELLFQYNSDRELSVIYTADGRRFVPDQREKKPDGFWDLFFSDDPSATNPNLSEVLQGLKEANSRGWARTVGSDLTAEELNHGGKELGGVVPDVPEGQKLSGLHDWCYRVPKEIADEINRSADEYLGKLNKGGESNE